MIPVAPPQGFIRSRRQYFNPLQASPSNILAQNLIKQARVKFIHLSDLTCQDSIYSNQARSLFDLSPSNTFCSYTKHCPSTCPCCSPGATILYSNEQCQCYEQCPIECTCKRSFDLTQNFVNCSHRDLTQLPSHVPRSATHLNFEYNKLKSLEKNLSILTNLRSLSVANNRLEFLSNEEFIYLNKLEDLDLSSNQITKISPRTFASISKLKHLYLHNNPWIPKFYSSNNEFQSNTRLEYLTYGLGLTCNRSIVSQLIMIEVPLSADDCCKHSNVESCQPISNVNEEFQSSDEQSFFSDPMNSWSSKRFINVLFSQKYRLYVLIGLIILSISSLTVVVLCCFCCLRGKKKNRKQPSAAERKLLPNGDSKKSGNHYHKSLQVIDPTTPQISSSSSTTAIQKLIQSTRQKSTRTMDNE